MELQNIFSDPGFKSAGPSFCYPNRQYGNGEIGALVLYQAARGQDFPLSKPGLERLMHSTRIKARYIVLAKKSDGGIPQFIASESAQTVLDRLQGVTPRQGKWGDYWWLTVNFMPVGVDQEVF